MTNLNSGDLSGAAAPTSSGPPLLPRRSAFAALIGNAFEYYDYFLYTTAAALVFGPLFFPSSDRTTELLISLATYAVGFLSRPLGGIFFGRLGDRHGRKKLMILTLSLMGFATISIGLLPTYQQIGLIAPILLVLLRLVQGFAAGGEWGGAILIATENAPASRRGFYGAWSQAGVGLGFVLASLAFYVAQQLPRTEFESWGWRVPFLLSIIIFGIGMFIRRGVEESADFVTSTEREGRMERPFQTLLNQHRGALFTAVGLRLAEICSSHLTTTFALAYGALKGVSAPTLVLAVSVSMLVDTLFMIIFGHLSDRIGKRKIYVCGVIGMALFGYPFFALISSGETIAILVGMVVANGLFHAAMVGVQPGLLTQLFPPRVRSSGIAFAQSIAAVTAGFMPLIAMSLTVSAGSVAPVAGIMVVLGIISLIAAKNYRHASQDPCL